MKPFDETIDQSAAQVKNADHVQRILQHLRLGNVARDAVQHQRVLLRMKPARLGIGIDKITPKLNRGLVRHQFTSAGILQKNLSDGAVVLEAAKYFAASAVEKIGDTAQDFALSPFSGSRRAEQQHSAVFHREVTSGG